MKIAFTADTHLVCGYEGMTTETQLEALRDAMYAEDPDIIVLGGDVGEVRIDLSNFSRALEILGEGKPGVVVAGNHDLWCNPGPITSEVLWSETIPKMCQDHGWHYLEDENWIKDGVAIVGSYLHYDYSSADPEGAAINHIRANFPDWTPDEYYERMKKRVVNDAKFFRGLPRDKEFARLIGEAFEKRLLAAEADTEVHSIVIVTHVPCMPCQITRKPYEWHWSCSTAYFGNLSHVTTIMGCSKIKYVLSGHSHQENRSVVKFTDGQEVDVITLGSDYAAPTFEIIEVGVSL